MSANLTKQKPRNQAVCRSVMFTAITMCYNLINHLASSKASFKRLVKIPFYVYSMPGL